MTYPIPIRRRPFWKRLLLLPRSVLRCYRVARGQGSGRRDALHIALMLSRVGLMRIAVRPECRGGDEVAGE